MSTHFLHLPRKTYYYRSVVPARLRRLLDGREQIWRSLKTIDKDEAQARSAAWDSRVQHLFLPLRRHDDKMTNEQREALVSCIGSKSNWTKPRMPVPWPDHFLTTIGKAYGTCSQTSSTKPAKPW